MSPLLGDMWVSAPSTPWTGKEMEQKCGEELGSVSVAAVTKLRKITLSRQSMVSAVPPC